MVAFGEYAMDETASAMKQRDYKDATDLVVALAENTIGRAPKNGGNGMGYSEGGPMYTLNTAGVHGVAKYETGAVRRLTPTECERLQGFPDGYTNIPWRGKPDSPDSPRYKALGNSMCVNVMRWIGERIQAVEDWMK